MKIGIISLGLIGGSLFKCLTQTTNEIYAVTRNEKTIQEAISLTPYVSNDLNTLKDCDIIFVASPINKTLEILDQLNNIVKKECIVLDCASVKQFVMNKNYNYTFIGSHPMAGTENNGYGSSFKELFVGAKWVLTPNEKTAKDKIEKAKTIIEQTGATVIIADAKEHDKAVALISHMPLLLSQALFNTVKENPLAMKLASSGFRDMTRLTMSNLEMAKDMREYNFDNINNALTQLNQSLDELKNSQNAQIFEDLKDSRQKMYSSDGKNIV